METVTGDFNDFVEIEITSSREWIRATPKAELHVHLEGSITPQTLLELGGINGIHIPTEIYQKLLNGDKFSSFEEFCEVYKLICRAIDKPAGLERLTYEFGQRMSSDGVVYAEVTWTPQLHVTKRCPFEEWLEAANKGRHRAEKEFGVTIRWILDILRDRPKDQDRVVMWATSEEAKAGGVVALGLGGTEALYEPKLFTRAFGAAREKGLHVVPHAGEHWETKEASRSIRDAVNKLGAERLGHGNRAAEDDELMEYLRCARIPLELCPTSNIKLGTYQSLSEHPFKKLLDAGCVVTVNTDDPGMFGTSLTDEFSNVAVAFGLSPEDLKGLIENAFSAAFDRDAAYAARQSSHNSVEAGHTSIAA